MQDNNWDIVLHITDCECPFKGFVYDVRSCEHPSVKRVLMAQNQWVECSKENCPALSEFERNDAE